MNIRSRQEPFTLSKAVPAFASMRVALALVLVSSCLYAQSRSSVSRRPPVGSSTTSRPYVNKEYGFSIHFPPGWTIKQPEFNENIIVKAVYRRADQAFAALNIYRYVFDSSVNAASLSPIQLFNMTYAKQGELLDSGVEFIGNHRTIWVKMRLKQFDATIYAVGYLIARDHDALWIYGNTVLGGMEWFETNLPLLLESIRTFQSF